MTGINEGRTRARMVKECLVLYKILSREGRMDLKEIAAWANISVRTARRWMNAFSMVMDLRIERGEVIVERLGRKSRIPYRIDRLFHKLKTDHTPKGPKP